jgi:hypothetical protein
VSARQSSRIKSALHTVSAYSTRGPKTEKSGATVGFSFRIVFDMVALELNELVEAELAQSLSLSRIFPSDPCKVLHEMSKHEVI